MHEIENLYIAWMVVAKVAKPTKLVFPPSDMLIASKSNRLCSVLRSAVLSVTDGKRD
ncbi:hypothetical protein M404DRAFT_1003255 [Pisolithus tinctorius Marx 270]|uniref:Uncharacterized protein n=1 Tax=Pisolithus tinctorius Marx 270 TaxID=870435 RepID=A0A0C3NJS6_PISTI|nr:hypothetical protein M404DRAFT_1003255 [Pisolithus tinctorius Marx 270]